MKRHGDHGSQQSFWDLVTAFVLSATVGMVLFNSFRVVSLHHASIDAESHKVAPKLRKDELALQLLMETRVCGSPAVDGYKHVNTSCILQSPTARWYREYTTAGGQLTDLVVHIEQHADYDGELVLASGLAVQWGINHKTSTPQECAKACWSHQPGKLDTGVFKDLPCNAFTYCNAETCFQPDAHKHTRGDCWLKFTEAPANPEVNMRGLVPEVFRQRHPGAPVKSDWISGVLLPPGVQLRNGTFGPRYNW